MRGMWKSFLMPVVAGSVAVGCGTNKSEPGEELGHADVELTNTPSDVSCLRITVAGARTDIRTFGLEENEKAVFRLDGLPVGNATFSADAFPVECSALTAGVEPTWYSEPKVARISAGERTHVALAMIHNGRVSVGVDFDDRHGGSAPEAGECNGSTSSVGSYQIPSEPGVEFHPILTAGDTAPDGYRMVGIPDGLGAFDNGDGTFTLLSNHELGANSGITRAHGAPGAFVSKWVVCKDNFEVVSGEDLIKEVVLWNPTTSSYDPPATGVAFGRLCSADLPPVSALYDAESGMGYDGRLFFDGEEIGDEGRGFAHGMDGTTWELPRTGKLSWENNVPNPDSGIKTIVAGLDDSGGGQVYFYAGTKTSSGSPVDMAGLTNGTLFGLRVVGAPVENPATGIADGPFETYDFGNVENMTGAELESESNMNLVTKFQRPEDGAWDPNNTNDFYFVTTASFSGNSRLWRVRFDDVKNPAAGGRFEMLLDGSEGQRMFDNIGIDQYGHVYLQEDPGGNDRLAVTWRYDIQHDTLTEVAKHDPNSFDPASPTLITNNEEASGIIDAADILGPGWFLVSDQIHTSNHLDPALRQELVQGGQFAAMFDPSSAN